MAVEGGGFDDLLLVRELNDTLDILVTSMQISVLMAKVPGLEKAHKSRAGIYAPFRSCISPLPAQRFYDAQLKVGGT